jgi:ADP-ribose pyrophosphatase
MYNEEDSTMYENLKEKCIQTNTVFTGRIIEVCDDVVELPNGKQAKREVVYHRGGVAIAALTEDNCLLFVRQYRYPHGEVLLELPAGKLETDEDPLEAGKRELKEECGAVGRDYQDLGVAYPSPGCYKENLYLYACRVESLEECSPDEDEFLEVEKIPLQAAVEMCLNNEIPDSKTQILILKVAALVQQGKL